VPQIAIELYVDFTMTEFEGPPRQPEVCPHRPGDDDRQRAFVQDLYPGVDGCPD
jgi:hypothetical protein